MVNKFFSDKSTPTSASFSPPHKKFRLSVLQAAKDEDKEMEIVAEVDAVEFDDEDQELQENQTDHDDDAEQMDQEGAVEFDQVDNMDDDSDVINNDNMYDLDGNDSNDSESDKAGEEKDDDEKDPNFCPFKTRSSSRKVRKRPDFYQAG